MSETPIHDEAAAAVEAEDAEVVTEDSTEAAEEAQADDAE